jgi:hypothetical protein
VPNGVVVEGDDVGAGHRQVLRVHEIERPVGYYGLSRGAVVVTKALVIQQARLWLAELHYPQPWVRKRAGVFLADYRHADLLIEQLLDEPVCVQLQSPVWGEAADNHGDVQILDCHEQLTILA